MCAPSATPACSYSLKRDAHESLLQVSPRSPDRDTPELIKPRHARVLNFAPFRNTVCRPIQMLASANLVRRRSLCLDRRSAMLYFVWYDDNPKKLVVEKIQEAIAAYVTRFAIQPSLLLVNVADHMEFTNVLVRTERTVQPNTFWLAYEEIAEVPTA
jgi:hypothetical protein